mmetsp:Transcript_35866/g.79865  ORF Transcript_35866/g.79865 Transcript_35866/m.79865 type:complete len:381 (-) Transcript_35866:1142-2284(-)|eukprot:CAMPEP_0202920422 /NCGR_PEP_ID=MMETSP1392-20130828/76828_1 /ASSEMBLY_ACC=CAM_ASM_000868 /TAXON_ID=225041 /ORGANISM="Chlamydomonas chlamydogama, Strain SAG 11-48b" /LENGTH=380 /DNA_ID=CAMNT_0049613917 /DNA_START=98 /DNA_END=1240 /DNA_ORIENTATION=+
MQTILKRSPSPHATTLGRTAGGPSLGPQQVVAGFSRRSAPAVPDALPSEFGELAKPMTNAGANTLADWASGYLTLLADASNSAGNMQKHLTKLMVKGAADASKLPEIMTDPINGISDLVADGGADILLKHFKTMSTIARGSQDAAAAAATAAVAESALNAAADNPVVNAVHSKAISVLLSCVMSGAAAGLADLQSHPLVDLSQNPTHVVMAAAATSAVQDGLMQRFGSFAVAPDLHSGASVAQTFSIQRASSVLPELNRQMSMVNDLQRQVSVVQDMGGSLMQTGGMAASTALRMLRADSKRDAMMDLGNQLGDLFLNTVKESMDGDMDPVDDMRMTHSAHILGATGRGATLPTEQHSSLHNVRQRSAFFEASLAPLPEA